MVNDKLIPLFRDSDSRLYYIDFKNDLKCSGCNAKIQSLVYISIDWQQKKESRFRLLCKDCDQKVFFVGKVIEKNVVRVIPKYKLGLHSYIIGKPQIIDSNKATDVWDEAKLQAPNVKDRTRLSGRPGSTWEGTAISDKDVIQQIVEREAVENVALYLGGDDATTAFLKSLNSMPTALPEHQKKQIDEGKHEN